MVRGAEDDVTGDSWAERTDRGGEWALVLGIEDSLAEVGGKIVCLQCCGSKWQPHVIVCIGVGHSQAAGAWQQHEGDETTWHYCMYLKCKHATGGIIVRELDNICLEMFVHGFERGI
jgi:hypothetical protein